jgi:hypothetical protein
MRVVSIIIGQLIIINARFTFNFITIVPGAPDMVIGKALNDKTISLHWKEPQQPNGIIVGYQILYYSYKEYKDEGTEMVPCSHCTHEAINLYTSITIIDYPNLHRELYI